MAILFFRQVLEAGDVDLGEVRTQVCGILASRIAILHTGNGHNEFTGKRACFALEVLFPRVWGDLILYRRICGQLDNGFGMEQGG